MATTIKHKPKGLYREHDYNRVFQYICRHKAEHDGNSPTVREIMWGCGISSTSVALYILRSLENDGRITMQGGSVTRTRSIQVVGGRWEAPAV